MLIGGGEVGRGSTKYETKEIDLEIVKMTEKKEPNFLFVGLASSFSDSYYDTMKKIYKELGCTCAYLKKKNIINNPDIVKKKINEADIIYFCGGDTIKLITDIKNYHLDILLREAINSNKVIAGMSAGAILLCDEGYSDAKILRGESDNFEFIKGLGIIDINFCPHYNKTGVKKEALKNSLRNTSYKVYALENGAALKISDAKYSLIKSIKEAKGYICYYKENSFVEELISC